MYLGYKKGGKNLHFVYNFITSNWFFINNTTSFHLFLDPYRQA
jgi:hypothetical protein